MTTFGRVFFPEYAFSDVESNNGVLLVMIIAAL